MSTGSSQAATEAAATPGEAAAGRPDVYYRTIESG